MKYLCEGCSRLVSVDSFRVRDGVLTLVCPACGAASQSKAAPGADAIAALVEEAMQAALPTPTLVERVRQTGGVVQERPRSNGATARPTPRPTKPLCPKCGAPRSGESCPRCGLVYSLFNPDELALPPALEKLWGAAERSANDPGAHLAFLEACTRAAVLPEAALRYRVFAEQNPGNPLAARFRDEAAARLLAISNLPETPSERPAARRGWLKPMLVAMLLCALAGTTFALWKAVSHRPGRVAIPAALP